MEADRQKKGACAQARIGQNPADEKQGGETGKHHHGIGKLRERVCDRMKSGGPGHALVQSGRRFQKMNDGEKPRGNQSRNGWARPMQQNSEEQAAEKRFFDKRDDDGCSQNATERIPRDRII